jgi:type IV secretory pathway protease TraF
MSYRTAVTGRTRLEVLDLAGQRVATLVNAVQVPGRYHQAWDGMDAEGRPLASGVYLMALHVAGASRCRRVAIVR